jgi:hypothetical protein
LVPVRCSDGVASRVFVPTVVAGPASMKHTAWKILNELFGAAPCRHPNQRAGAETACGFPPSATAGRE